jgi:PIN domain nuclease of toxin-antitoxin system
VLSAQRQLFLSWISLWEIRALVEKKKVNLPVPIAEWLHLATPAKVCLVDLSSDIAAHQLPGDFSARQTNRIIVATARCRQMTVVTAEEEILNYPHVQSLDPR